MASTDQFGGYPIILSVLSRVCESSLDHWLERIHQSVDESAPRSFYPSYPHFLEDHRQRLWDLIRKSTPLPDVQVKAARLSMHLDPVMRANGHHADWVRILRMLAVAMLDRGLEESLLLANLWRSIGRCYEQVSEFNRAKAAFNLAERFAVGQGEPSADFMAELRQEAAALLTNRMQFSEAEEAALELLADAHQRRDNYTLMLGHTLLAYAFIQNARYEKAFTQAQQGFVLATALAHNHLAAQSLQYMAEACRMLNNPARALVYLNLVRQREDVQRNSRWMAFIEQNLGSVLVAQGDYKQAIFHLSKASGFFEEIEDRNNLANCWHALGLAMGKSGQYEAAVALLRKSVLTWQDLGNTLNAANTLYALGWIHRWADQPGQAIQVFREAWQFVIADSNSSHRCQRLKKNLEEALTPNDEPDNTSDALSGAS